VLSGTVAQFNDAFGVDLQQFEHAAGSYRGRTGAIHLPDELHGVVTAVLGLDNRPQARPHFRTRPTHGNVQWHAAAAAAASFTPTQLAALYGFPASTGQGECIAIIELGGGYRTTDLQRYFLGVQVTQPRVLAVSVDHGKNHPTGSGNGPDGEVMLVTHRLRRPAMDETGAELIVSGTAPSAQRSGFAWCEKPVC